MSDSREAIIERNLAGIESHFHAEDSGSVSDAIAAFTEDCVWEAPNPIGLHRRVEGKAALRPFYESLFATMKDVDFQICFERFATVDRVGTLVFMRIVHVFDMRDGLITKEKVFEMRTPADSPEQLHEMVEAAKVGTWQPGRMSAGV